MPPTRKTKRERDSFSDKEAARTLGISLKRLYAICDYFDEHDDDAWDLIEGESFEYEPGQAGKRRFYEEGMMEIAKYLEETEGGSFLAKLREFFTHHRERVRRTLVRRRMVQVTQDRRNIVIRGDLIFLEQRSVVRVLGTNGKGMAGPIRRIQRESAGLEGAQGLEIGVHFDDFDDRDQRHWSQLGIVRLAKTMNEKGKITRARREWVKAVADVAEECLEIQRKLLESHEARIRAAKDRVRRKTNRCLISGQKPDPASSKPIELDVHHLFDAETRPDLAAYEDNLLVVDKVIHRNFHKWMQGEPCEPEHFIEYLQRNELHHFEASGRARKREEQRLQKLIGRLELLQARFEDNRLLY